MLGASSEQLYQRFLSPGRQSRGILLTFNKCKAFLWLFIVYLWSALESHSVSTVNTERSADKRATKILHGQKPEESWLKQT